MHLCTYILVYTHIYNIYIHVNMHTYRDKTVSATAPLVEKTTEQVGKIHENMKPTVEAGMYMVTY
jgi:hypothetical protein